MALTLTAVLGVYTFWRWWNLERGGLVTKAVAGGVAVSEPSINRSTASCLPIFSVTEAGRKKWWSRVQGCGPECVQGSVQGSFCEVLEKEGKRVQKVKI